MKHILKLLIFAIAILPCGCACCDDMAATVSNTTATEPNVKAFNSLFTKTTNFISYFTGDFGQPRWNSIAGIHGRYELTMQFDVDVNRTNSTLRSKTDPQFFLVEIQSIDLLPDGRVSIGYNPLTQHKFGTKEWEILIRASGDFKSIGINLIKDSPIAGFERVLPN